MSAVKKLVGDVTGANQAAKAARTAADAQKDAAERGIRVLQEGQATARQDYQPYVDVGKQGLEGLGSLVNDPNAQLKFIEENPFFKSLADTASRTLFANQAARGKVGSGETANELQTQLLNLGTSLVDRTIGSKFDLANLGYNATAGQANAALGTATGVADLKTQQGNASAAGIISAQNAINKGRGDFMNAVGSAAGGAAGTDKTGAAGAGAGLAKLFACDINLKTDIKKVGALDNGLPLYLFRYKGDDKLHINVMAQDVEKVKPEAVIEIDGFKYVNLEEACH